MPVPAPPLSFGRLHDRPGLLVSIQSADELDAFGDTPVDIVDAKCPDRGPLGRLAPEALDQIARRLAGQTVRTSVALGELAEWKTIPRETVARYRSAVRPFDFAKFGLAGLGKTPGWPDLWANTVKRLEIAQPVAVIYADRRTCNAPPADDIVAAAEHFGCPAVLIDTWSKRPGNHVFRSLPHQEIRRLVARIQGAGMLAVLAGSISLNLLPQVATSQPDMIGVRGAVCSGDRRTAIDPDRLAHFSRQLLARKRSA